MLIRQLSSSAQIDSHRWVLGFLIKTTIAGLREQYSHFHGGKEVSCVLAEAKGDRFRVVPNMAKGLLSVKDL